MKKEKPNWPWKMEKSWNLNLSGHEHKFLHRIVDSEALLMANQHQMINHDVGSIKKKESYNYAAFVRCLSKAFLFDPSHGRCTEDIKKKESKNAAAIFHYLTAKAMFS